MLTGDFHFPIGPRGALGYNLGLMDKLLLGVLSAMLSGLALAEEPSGKWVLVTPPEWESALQPLAAARRTQGLEVVILHPDPSSPAGGSAEEAGNDLRRRIREAAGTSGPRHVLLAGDFPAPDDHGASLPSVPSARGSILRMTDRPSDNPFGCPDGSREPDLAVGRLPVRSEAEARAAVEKILAFEQNVRQSSWARDVRLVAGYHEAPPSFAPLADNVINNLGARLISRLPPAWRLAEALVHINGSPWQTPGAALPALAHQAAARPGMLLAYMGHSAAEGAVSKSQFFFGSVAWPSLKQEPRLGLLFTCGCHACEVGLPGANRSWGAAAFLSPGGPAAVIGSHGESSAAMGYLAITGVLEGLREKDPRRVGDLFLSAKRGIARSAISDADYALLTLGDGLSFQATPADVRQEHLEMWMLFGDPAMLLSLPPVNLALTSSGAPGPGSSLTITGQLPPGLATATLRFTLERLPGTTPAEALEEVPSSPEEARTRAMVNNLQRQNTLEITSHTIMAEHRFSLDFKLPDPCPWEKFIVRVRSEDGALNGALLVPKPEEESAATAAGE